jgi:hypothetical protein
VLNLCFVLVTKKRSDRRNHTHITHHGRSPRAAAPGQRQRAPTVQQITVTGHHTDNIRSTLTLAGTPVPSRRAGVARRTRHPHEPPLVPSARRCAEGGGDLRGRGSRACATVTGTVCLCASRYVQCRARAPSCGLGRTWKSLGPHFASHPRSPSGLLRRTCCKQGMCFTTCNFRHA